jgi:antitoxin component YwqK of YwqJK toxin-antitoxin module
MRNQFDPTPAPGRFRRSVILCVVLACTICTAFVCMMRKDPVVRNDEASPSSLLLRDGRWYRQGGVQPFTGILSDYYPDGSRKSRSLVSNGFLEGLSEGWYSNGVKQVTEFYHAGVSHGTRTKWYDSGQKLSEVAIVDGKLEGIFSRYYEDGQLAESITLKNGLPDGPSSSYYPSGFLKAEARLAAGKLIEQKFWNDRERTSASLSRPPVTAPGGEG